MFISIQTCLNMSIFGYPFVSFVGGVSILHVPYAPCIEYLPTCYHEFKANVSKYFDHLHQAPGHPSHASRIPTTSGCRRKCYVAWLRCDGHGSHGTWANGRPPGPVGPVGCEGEQPHHKQLREKQH